MATRAGGVLEPGFEEMGCFGFVAGEEVAVAVEGDGDAGVAHVRGEGFGVDAGGDHVGGVGVAAFVQADRSQAGVVPGCFGLVRDAPDAERLGACLAEREPVSAVALAEPVFEQDGAEGGAEWDAAFA